MTRSLSLGVAAQAGASLPAIGLLISSEADRKLFSSLLAGRGHPIIAPSPAVNDVAELQATSLIIADEEAAGRHHGGLLDLKNRIRPVILPILVALSHKADGASWLGHGFDDLLRWPFSKNDLLARAEAFLRMRRQSEEAVRTSEAFSRSTLDAIAANICVVDGAGTIILVNAGWREFAAGNGARETRVGEGANYLQVCEVVSRDPDADVRESAASVREVIQGVRPSCFVEYPCLAPDKQRWFTASATRFGSGRSQFTVIVHTDVTERKLAEAELRDSEERFRSLTGLSSDSYWEQEEHYRFTVFKESHAQAQSAESVAGSLIGKRRWDLDFVNMSAADWDAHRTTLEGRLPFRDLELCRLTPSGELWTSSSGEPVFDAAGCFKGYRGIGKTITERKRVQQLLALEHAVSRCLAQADSISEALRMVMRAVCESQGLEIGVYWRWDEPSGRMRFGESWIMPGSTTVAVEKHSRHATFQPGEGLVGHVWQSGQTLWVEDVTLDPRVKRKDMAKAVGKHAIFLLPILAEGRIIGVLDFVSRTMREPDERVFDSARAVGSQIGQYLQRKEAEQQMMRLAHFDALTNLPNRVLFHDRLNQALMQAIRGERTMALLFIDLDRFKMVNDSYGHPSGDRLLQQVAQRLERTLRSGDTVGRLGGDEFAAILTQLASAADAGRVCEKILDAFAPAFDLDGHEVFLSASIGISLCPTDGTEAQGLMQAADTAMYRAKELGKNNFQFYTPELNRRSSERLALEGGLRRALEREEYVLHYQPRIELASRRIVGVEALLRWRPSSGELIPPLAFIPVLEETGLIAQVGEWVVREVCRQLRAWHDQGLDLVPVAVNLSARQFQQPELAATVGEIVRSAGLDAHLLEFEITESLLIHNEEGAARTLRDLRAMGASLAIDDFGTGYSSLSYLKRFPLDALKIDKSFVRDVCSDPDDAAITLAILRMAQSLKLRVIAEGVETEEQLAFLAAHGCDEVQGFLFHRPLPVEAMTKLLRAEQRLQADPA